MANSRVRREAMRLARAQIKFDLIKQGVSLSIIEGAKLNTMVYALANNPEIKARAQQNVVNGIALPRHKH